MRLTVISDVHIGAVRSAGTTPASQLALRHHLLDGFKNLLPTSGDLLINGDLFDTSNIPMLDVLRTFEALSDWLHMRPTAMLYNSAGNHDLSKTSTTLSSFQFLGKLLSRQFPERYVHIEEPTMTPHGYVVPHLRNQDVFDLAVEAVPACAFAFFHANYDNGFAAQSDQSLNLSKQQAEDCQASTLIFGHEHHPRAVGKVLVPGNQLASSVSDWLQAADKKFVVIEDGAVTFHTASRRADEFSEVNWKELGSAPNKKFIRVSGVAQADEISNAVTALNRLRASSDALVITNAIEAVSDDGTAEAFSSNLDSVQAFDIVAALRKIFDAEEMKTLEPFLC